MPSPFPGMDPYLESWIWPDFHRCLVCALRGQLNAELPHNYVARLHIQPEDSLEWPSIRIVNLAEKRVFAEIDVCYPPKFNAHGAGEAEAGSAGGVIGNRLNVVEIDLLRARPKRSLMSARLPDADYYIFARRAAECDHLLAWPFSVRDRFPAIRVPMGPGLPEIALDMRSAMDRVYEEGRYAEQLDYTKPPTPPLREADASWARDLLAARLNPPKTA